ncbi:MAG: hypothetical protein ACPIOQ_41310, partial [Promethearchaeia archaeon]
MHDTHHLLTDLGLLKATSVSINNAACSRLFGLSFCAHINGGNGSTHYRDDTGTHDIATLSLLDQALEQFFATHEARVHARTRCPRNTHTHTHTN